jgi:predicted metalloprotease with PDZ domain
MQSVVILSLGVPDFLTMFPALRSLLLLVILCAPGAWAEQLKIKVLPGEANEPQPLWEITYRLTPVWSGDERHFRVEMAFQAGPGEVTPVRLPTEFGAGRDLHTHIRNLRTLTAWTTLRDGADETRRVLVHQPNQQVVLAWEVHGGTRKRLEHETFYNPIFAPGYFQFFGHAAFVYPEYLDKGLVTINFEWRDLPGNWSLAGSHGVRAAGPVTKWRVEGVSLAAARHAVYVGGDFRVQHATIRGRPLYVAIRGKWAFSDVDFLDASRRVVEAHREFWNDFEFPFFLITLIPNDIERGSSGGTAIRNAFAMNVSRDFRIQGDQFDFLIGHEHLHTWVPVRLGTMGKDEARRYWFSEGFTNYLTHRLLVKSGLWNLEQYAGNLNEIIRKHVASRVAGATNEQVMREFWQDRDVQDLPYRRGEFLAMRWNAKLYAKNSGQSLDALLRGMLTKPGETELATTRLTRALAPHIGGIESDIERFIERGEPMEFPRDLAGPCFTAHDEALGEFELGFDPDATLAAKAIVGVKPGSAAFRAGLRDGQAFRGYSYAHGDTRREAEVTIEVEKQKQVLKFMPVGPATLKAVQYTPKHNAESDPACKAWFAI